MDYIRTHLESEYKGVFDAVSIENHLRDYVGFTFADQVMPVVAVQVPANSRMLDIGSGFGACVVAGRRRGIDAVGIEIAPFEVAYARNRLQIEEPGADSERIFLQGNALKLPFEDGRFDVVTMWNVAEHILDIDKMFSEIKRVLKPDGLLFLICPNYASFRKEAHYSVFWPPLLPKKLGTKYLELLGKDPSYLNTGIFYRTNWEILFLLRKKSFQIREFSGNILVLPKFDPELEIKEKIRHPGTANQPANRKIIELINKLKLENAAYFFLKVIFQLRHIKDWWTYLSRNLRIYNPFVQSIIISARKKKI
jgi:MPBQ/MSBQ methyltransferase